MNRYYLHYDSALRAILQKRINSVNENDIRELLRQFNLKSGLIGFSKLIKEIHLAGLQGMSGYSNGTLIDPETQVAIPSFVLGFFANELILCSNEHRKKNLFQNNNILALPQLYFDYLYDPIIDKKNFPYSDDEFLLIMLIRSYYEQFIYQSDALNLMARQLLLWLDILPKLFPDEMIILGELFQQNVGIELRKFFNISFLIYCYIGLVQEDDLVEFSVDKFKLKNFHFTNAELKSCIDFYKCTKNEFVELDKRLNQSLAKENYKHKFLLLRKKPLVELNDGTILCPSIYQYIEASTKSLYWFMDDLIKRSKCEVNFGNLWGTTFENYVQKMLCRIFKIDNYNKIVYAKDKREFLDFHCIVGQRLYLFECKASKISLNHQINISPENILNEVKTKIRTSIEQVNKRIDDISKYEELSKLRELEIVPFIIYYEIPEISKRIYEFLISPEIGNQKYLPYKNLFLLEIQELELYSTVAGDFELFDIVQILSQDDTMSFLGVLRKLQGTDNLKCTWLRSFLTNFIKIDLGLSVNFETGSIINS